MRIVLVTNQFPKFSETFIVHEMLGLLEQGWDVHVVCPSSGPQQWEYFPALRAVPDVDDRVHVTGDAMSAIRSLRPDIVHFEFGATAVGRIDVGPELGCRTVVSFRGYDLNDAAFAAPGHYAEVWDKADIVHVVSGHMWERAMQRGCPPDKPHVVLHDAADTRYFAPTARRAGALGTADRPLHVLSVGRLHWKKGYEFSLEAVRLLAQRGVVCRYRIVGEGDHRPAVAFTVEDAGLGGVVELCGAQPRDAVREHLAWADVLVHAAVTEGFCVSVLEAQATGLPVVCSDAGGLPENVAHGETGFVVRRRDPAALADRLELLAQAPLLRRQMGAAGRRRVDSQFSYEHQMATWESLYRSLAGDVASPRPAAPTIALLEGRVLNLELGLSRLEREWRRRTSVACTRRAAAATVPAGSTVLVVSRGDDDLLALGRGSTGVHFPSSSDGVFAGHHPADSGEAIALLEKARDGGAGYLIVPPTSSWWLDHYAAFRRHLETRYVARAQDGVAIFELCAHG